MTDQHDDEEGNGWPGWRRKVISDIAEGKEKDEKHDDKIAALEADMKVIKVVAMLLGALSGVFSSLLTYFLSRIHL